MVVEQVLLNNDNTTAILNDKVPLSRWKTVLINGFSVDVICVTGFGDAIGIKGLMPDIIGKSVSFV